MMDRRWVWRYLLYWGRARECWEPRFGLAEVCLLGVFVACTPARGWAQSEPEAVSQEEPPSPALLEFLAEFGDLDQQTFDLIVFHGLQDASKQKNVNEERREDGEGEHEPQ